MEDCFEMMGSNKYKIITKKYYSSWLGVDIDSIATGIEFVYSKERNLVQPGHGCRYDLWMWLEDNKWIISYGDKVRDDVVDLKNMFSAIKTISELHSMLKEKYDCRISHGIKYVYHNNKTGSDIARVLQEDDYLLYEEFFKKCNPKCKDVSWLKDYFRDMTREGLCCGVVVNDGLVACTDAPEVSYMRDSVQEIGINTLQEYRGQNYATECCKLCVEKILQKGKTPLWSTSISNIASQKVAEHVGFLKFGEYIGMTLSE